MRVLLAALLILLGATPAAAATAPLGGGSVLFNASTRCTASFAATRGTTGFLIARRCGTPGTELLSGANIPVGPVDAELLNGGASVVRVTNTSAWTLVPWIASGGTQYVIAGSNETPVGGSVCVLDATLGQRCGVITAKNVTVNFADGTISGLTRTNICLPTGSGIAFVTGNQAQGVPMGGSDCTSSGVSYFVPVRTILSAYGLTLVTG